jgi:hypothetical protein
MTNLFLLKRLSRGHDARGLSHCLACYRCFDDCSVHKQRSKMQHQTKLPLDISSRPPYEPQSSLWISSGFSPNIFTFIPNRKFIHRTVDSRFKCCTSRFRFQKRRVHRLNKCVRTPAHETGKIQANVGARERENNVSKARKYCIKSIISPLSPAVVHSLVRLSCHTDTAAPIWTGRYPRITDIGKTSVEFTVQVCVFLISFQKPRSKSYIFMILS